MAKPTLADLVEFFTKAAKGGAREIDMGDIKSPPLKRGRPSKAPPVSTPIDPNEIDVGNIDPLTIKKGRPAKSPIIDPNEIDLGKSKGKLEIGDSPSTPVSVNEIDVGNITPINPNIDDYRLPISSIGTDAVGGGKVPAIMSQAEEVAGPLSKRSTTIPTEVGPEVLGKGTSRFTKKADDVIDAEIVTKMPDSPLKSLLLKRLAIGGAAVLGTGALLSQLGDDQSPSVNFSAAKINGMPSEKDKVVNPVEKTGIDKVSSGQESRAEGLDKAIQEVASKIEQDRKPAESDRLAYMEMMQNAQQAENQNQLSAALLKAGMQAGAAIAGPGVKVDTSIADALAKSASKPVSNVKSLMETEAASRKLKELEKQEKDDAESRDPKSAKSIAARKQWSQYLPNITEDMSAYDITKDLNQKIQILTTKEAAKSREFIAKESQLARKEKEAKEAEEKETQRLEKRKLITEEVEGFRSNIKQNLARAKELLDKAGTFELFGSEAEELSALMDEVSTDMAKLQDPKSVARPTEVKLVRKNLVPEGGFSQLGMSNATARELLDQFEKRVDARANTAYGVRGLDAPKPSESSKLTTPSSTRVFKSSYKPGSIVTTTSGSYQIGEDGKTGTKLNE